MYCGICVEVCPFDALFWSPEFEYAEYDIRDMTHEKERLREWMWTVPPPPPLDPLAEPAKEVAAVEKARAEATTPERETRAPRTAEGATGPERVPRGDAGNRREPGTPREPRPDRPPRADTGNGAVPVPDKPGTTSGTAAGTASDGTAE
jgi:NADH-quinone oxidoreductase subunit I